MEKLISVVINVYNCEKFITKCLESVINQTYKNLEILIINDGSTDNTLKICESYKDERIRIITTQNFGLSKSRNIGIDNAKGEYLYFIDADDFIENDTIEYLYNMCKTYNVKISSCRTKDIYDYNFIFNNENEEIKIISNLEMLKKILLSKERAGNFWNKLYVKELFDDLRFEERPINDVVIVYKLILKVEKIAYSNQVKYYYLQRKDSITGIRKENRSIDLYKAVVERYNYIKNIYPNLIENDICLISKVLMLYGEDKEKLQDFLKQEQAEKMVKKLISWKVFKFNVSKKIKIKMLLFKLNPKMYKKISKKYKEKNYKM